MTKKDYELIAKAISLANERVKINSNKLIRESQQVGIIYASQAIADFLKKDNPKFNRIKFLLACKKIII